MQLNYISNSGVRIGNTAGYLAINGLRNGTDILDINGAIQIFPADREGGAGTPPNLLVLVIFHSFF